MTDKQTGYPSVDKPWLKYYEDEIKNKSLPKCFLYEYIYSENMGYKKQVALEYFGTKITYKKLFQGIENVAKSFYEIGIRKGDKVTIMSLITPETIYCIYALNMLGAVVNMAYISLSEKEIVDMVKSTGSKALVALDIVAEKIQNVSEKISDIKIICPSIGDSMSKLIGGLYRKKTKNNIKLIKEKKWDWNHFYHKSTAIHIEDIKAEYKENEPALIVYTSGTTGAPKGVVLSNESINAIAFQYSKAGFDFKRNDTMLTFMPPFLAIGFSLNVHTPLVIGLRSIICVDPEPNNVVKQYKKTKPNHFVAAPSNVLQIMRSISGKMKYCKTMAGGGESMSADKQIEINKVLKDRGARAQYITGYGMSEFAATVTTTNHKINGIDTLGIPLCKTNIKVVDPDTGEELQYDETGELCFCTPSSMLYYLDNPEETEKIMEKDSNNNIWIHTGDLGTVDRDGLVHFVGRIKRIYLSKGADGVLYKVFPQRVEELVLRHKDVEKSAVIAVEDEERLHTLTLFIVKKKEAHDEELLCDLRKLCERELPSHHWPNEYRFVNCIPYTQSGKVDYRKLADIREDQLYHAKV
ncbi:MAG: class I adenylate-forming enzyme family protein [Acetatifactor sp.]